MWNHLIKSQQGLALIQGIFLAAAVAALALLGTKLTTTQKHMQKGIESKNRVEQLHNMLYSILQDKDHCTQTLILNNLTTDAHLGTTTSHSLSGILTKSTPTLANAQFKINDSSIFDPNLIYMNNGVAINSMELTYPDDFANTAILRINYGRLEESNVRRRSGKGTATQDITKSIELKIQRNMANAAFESCYAVTDNENKDMIKDFCEDIVADGVGPSIFEWNEQYQTCVLRDLQCSPGEIYAGFNADGSKRCYPLNQWMDLNDLIDNSTPPIDCANKQISFEVVGQKVRIKCT